MRKGPAWIKSKRSKRWKNGFGEIAVGSHALGFGELRIFHDVYALFCQTGQKLEAQTILSGFIKCGHALADGSQFLRGRHTVGSGFESAAFQLALQARDPDHEKLVKIRTYDGQELQALEKRVLVVLSLFKDASLKCEQTDLTVQVERRILKRKRWGN